MGWWCWFHKGNRHREILERFENSELRARSIHLGGNSDLDRVQSTRERRTSSYRQSPNSSRRSILSSTNRLVLCIRVLGYDHLGSLVSITLRTLPIQWQNSLPCGRAGAMHRRRSRIHHVAEQIVNEVVTVISSATNLPNSL